jgi:Type II secretion system (T2SS), protein N
MPASRSPNRGADIRRPARRWPWVLLGLALLFLTAVFTLPASMITRALPAAVRADDFSGSLLHGAAGKLIINSRDAGAIEWQIHPAALLRLALLADIHWVKLGFVINATAQLGSGGIHAQDINGGGPIEDLSELGVAPGWRGHANLAFTDLRSDFHQLQAAVGKIEVSNLTASGIADGSELGGYVLTLPAGGVAADGSLAANLNDTGGPLELQAQLHFSPATRVGLLSGTLKERADASPALIEQLRGLSQLRPRDSAGRFPVELEFSF